MSVCNKCGIVTPDSYSIKRHLMEGCETAFCRHGMISWFSGECGCRFQYLEKELETTKKQLDESVKLISEMEEYLGRFGMKNSIESTSLFHASMTEFLAKLSKEDKKC